MFIIYWYWVWPWTGAYYCSNLRPSYPPPLIARPSTSTTGLHRSTRVEPPIRRTVDHEISLFIKWVSFVQALLSQDKSVLTRPNCYPRQKSFYPADSWISHNKKRLSSDPKQGYDDNTCNSMLMTRQHSFTKFFGWPTLLSIKHVYWTWYNMRQIIIGYKNINVRLVQYKSDALHFYGKSLCATFCSFEGWNSCNPSSWDVPVKLLQMKHMEQRGCF